MARYYLKVHPNEEEVRKIENMEKNTDERTAACDLLRHKGDFLHNCAVFKSKTGVLIVMRRPSEENPIDYS